MKPSRTLGSYLSEDSVSPAAHSLGRRRALAKRVLGRKRIYLDQKYWIYCRDAMLGRPQKPIHDALWAKLLTLVSAAKVLCPAGITVLLETQKQRDPKKLAATAWGSTRRRRSAREASGVPHAG